MSSKKDVFLEETRLGPRSDVFVECEEVSKLPNVSSLLIKTEYFLVQRIDEDTTGQLQTERRRNARAKVDISQNKLLSCAHSIAANTGA